MHNTPHSFTVKGLLLLSSAVAVATLVACGGGGSSASTGTLQLAMTDSPGCGYDQVNVTVTKIRLHQSATATDSDSGWQEIAVASPTKINLLSLTNGVLQELGSLPMPAGRYEQVRLVLSSAPLANSLVLTGSTNEIALSTPSGQQSGYKLQAHFDVTGNQVADMVLDFDACKSIVRAGNSGTYNLKPVVAVTERLTTQIEGYVDPAIAPNVVVSTRDPIGQLRATVPDSTGKFVIAYLPANTNYTVVLSGTNPSTMPLTTAAITGVPVSTTIGSTQLNTSSTRITLPASTTAQVTGTVTNASSAPLLDASVNAQQILSTSQALDVAWGNVDPTTTTAQYSLTLPLAAPLKASYVSNGGPLSFSPDNVTPGLYMLYGSASGYTTQSTNPSVTLGAAGTTTTKNLVLTP